MNINELDSYDLGDAVKFNEKLNPRLWTVEEHLRPEVREQLLKIADDFAQSLGVNNLQLKDITISGSNAAYTYTPHSDIDLHLVVDLPEADNSEVYRELFDAKKYQYNDLHNIKIGGYDVELYVENANEPPVSQGMYSVLNNKWIQVPRRRRPSVDDISTQNKYETLLQHINQAIRTDDFEQISALADKIKRMRQTGLEEHGEFGPENLAFKMLRSQGLIEKLYSARNQAKDRLLSLDEREKQKKDTVKYGFGGYWYPGTGYAGQDTPAAQEASDEVNENQKSQTSNEEILKNFIKFCVAELKIEQMPTIKLRKDPQWPVVHKTFGRYINDKHLLEVAWGHRHIMDVLRTVAHELTHRHQHERDGNRMGPDAGETGSPWENEANARAGILMRDYARLHPEFFAIGQAKGLHEASGYIPTAAEAKDPRFEMALSVDVQPGALGRAANALDLHTDSQGHPQLLRADGLFESLLAELKSFKKEGRIPNRPLSQVPGEIEDDLGNQEAMGPEFPPQMPAGTTKVDVSDLTDWYKLGQDISDMDDADPADYNQGPPQTVIVFPSDDMEQGYLDQFKRLGLKTHDMDPDVEGGEDVTGKHQPKRRLKEEELNEVRMAPSNLQQWARSPEAEGIRAGFEAELIFRDTTNGDGDDQDMEPDYDADERCNSIQGIIEFFSNGDYGYMSQRQQDALEEQLSEQYYEWFDNQRYEEWQDNREELVRDAHLEETPWEERIHAFLVDGMEMTDEQADAVQALAKQREDGKIKGSEMSEEQLDMITAYSEAREGADDILDEDVEQSINKEDRIYEQAKEEFDDNFSIDDDRGFFDDVGLRWMSDVANEYDLDWPYMTGAGGNDGSRDWDSIGDSLNDAIDMPVKVSSGYHSATRKEGLWIVEPDSSLEPDDREDYGLEIVSPPMPLLTALDKLQEVCDWANDSNEGNAYTNSSTGLHMGVSVPYKGGDVDYVKLILFLGDEYVLQSFGREANTYCASAMKKLKQNVGNSNARYAANVTNAMELMRGNLIELANREIQKGVGESKYTSVHLQKGYIEFRSAGGDWLAEESADPEKLSSTMLRYARAMQIAATPSAERREYAKKLYKLIAPEGDDALGLFSQFTAGELDKEQLKKRWAEKTIGIEKKMNQRWKLYKLVDGVWTSVPGGEWNGYTEDQVKNAVWSKYGREALDTGEYQLVNTSEGQEWEIYDVKTGKTLEIVKGKNKGEAADLVFDKYAEQGIGFNVRPYVDPNTLTPRAKLAKRIVEPKKQEQQKPAQAVNERGVPYWEVFERETGHVVHTFLSDTMNDAVTDAKNWLTSIGAEQPNLFSVRPKMNDATPIKTDDRGEWEFYRAETGNVIDRVNNASQSQAEAVRQDIVRRYGHADSSVGMRRIDQSVNENFADGKGPGRPGDSQRHGIPKGATIAQLEKAAKAPGRKGQLARWQLNMRRGQKK